jgi:MFS family permease
VESFPVSIYLVSYPIGKTIFAPLSDNYGRRTVNLVTIFGFMMWITACTFAPSWAAFVSK